MVIWKHAKASKDCTVAQTNHNEQVLNSIDVGMEVGLVLLVKSVDRPS